VHILNSRRFHKALKEKGYRTIGQFARSLDIHRNSIHYYLSGHGVLQKNFEKIIKALGLKVHEIIIDEEKAEVPGLEQIASLIDMLHMEFPDVTFVLFGSRSRGTAHKYADWDVGVFSDTGLTHESYRRIVQYKNVLVEDLPFFVDLINLNRADKYFLREVSKDWKFLTGKLNQWIKLQNEVTG
jgi:predicted nucleotidyltransferase